MKNEEIYEAVQTIVDSQEMRMTVSQPEDAVTTINLLRGNVKTLIDIVYTSRLELKEVQRIVEMLQKMERAKTRFIERAIDDKIRGEHKDIMSYDARNDDAIQISAVKGKIDLNSFKLTQE
jgi:hypothetical protein|tara:strand:- start:988 stop:1350 length:363 start_codon:yes stop_codon:yes gene_type:complete